MEYESIKVDIIPGAENAEVLHFSQYDNKRPFFIELFNGGAEFIPESGMSLTLECKKRDGNIVILSDPVLNDNVAEFSTTEQLTACYGDNEAEIKIVDDNDLVIGSANFIINVEKSPTCGGITSQSDIDNLTHQIEEITQEVIGNDYYNKAQTDALLENKADVSDIPDMTNYYTKPQTDELLDDKADRSELSALASKAELTQAINDEDTALKNWAFTQFATPGYIASRYYNKNEVDNLCFNMLPTGIASGNPCIFNTEIVAALQKLTAEIVCGGGNGTTDNPIPIVGHSEINLDVNGQTFTVAFGQTVYCGVYDKSGRLTITHQIVDLGSLNWNTRSTRTPNVYRMVATLANKPTPDNQPFNAICEVYVPITGNATYSCNTGVSGSSDGTSIYVYDADYNTSTSATAFKTAMSGKYLVYPLATPIVIDVPSISVFAENGTNNIISDCGGDVNVSYKDTIQHYIDSRI